MIDFIQEYRLWFLAFHVISVICWMAGMFYLPRLFIYHCRLDAGSDASEMFKLMERRLLRLIINPAMTGTWIFGFCLAFAAELWATPWFMMKFTLVIVMSGFHGFLARWRRYFARDDNRHTASFYRKMNEVPTVLMIAIVILVFVRPLLWS